MGTFYLQIDYQSLTRGGSDASVGALLFDSDLAPSTVENLTLTGGRFIRLERVESLL